MSKKKKRTALPRVTVLAYNRRDLVAFVQAVERLGLYVEELRLILEKKKTPKKLPPSPPANPTREDQSDIPL